MRHGEVALFHAINQVCCVLPAEMDAIRGTLDRSTPKPWMAFGALALAGALLIGAFAADRVVEDWARGALPETRRAATLVSHYMDWPFVIGAFLVVGGVFGFLKRGAFSRLSLGIALAAAVAGLSATVVRTATGRTRPSATIAQGWYGIRHDNQWILGRHAYSSFPSGHTATVAGAVGALWRIRRRWGAAGLGLIGLVAWGRVFAGAHHFSDVTAAAILGLALGYATIGWLRRRVAIHNGPAV